MTSAYRVLRQDQINDATPQLNVLQRVGGSIGVALVAVVLQSHLLHAGLHASASARASSFGATYIWILAVTAVATLPTLLLIRMERLAATAGRVAERAGQPVIEAA
jgi:hypothetical protein